MLTHKYDLVFTICQVGINRFNLLVECDGCKTVVMCPKEEMKTISINLTIGFDDSALEKEPVCHLILVTKKRELNLMFADLYMVRM